MAINKLPLADEHDAEPPQQQQPTPAAAPAAPGAAHPHGHGHAHSLSNASTATVDVEAWTAEALASLSISPAARGTGTALAIALDTEHAPSAPRMKLRNIAFDGPGGAGITPARRAPMRRDSMKKRDELLRGKEGSRQRRRWENDHLLHVPNAQPPLPTDWAVHPTHPVLPTVPYALAQYWDKGLRERVEERKAAFAVHRKKGSVEVRVEVGRVPRDLRAKAKKTPAVKSWLRVLEEPVRQFLVDTGLVAKVDESAVESDTDEDEEIVFVGRNGSMMDGKTFKKAQRVEKEKPVESGMVLDTTGDDESGAFKYVSVFPGSFSPSDFEPGCDAHELNRRFLTHSISEYYGLSSKSVTMGNPARRVVYIGIKHIGQRHAPPFHALPPPLWEVFEK
ncbi:R3H-associated N-terminal domain-containing protein [Podospora aff. communis PSN243]|uniref:R3H-associated N-terminal domain-containing protein n=1 Tax=Podospora aff. communis PSN243 TaxID=3040156 RepID=A0AAV9GJT5_9PEZI|nr:R3H-associated N-terminal domain-containing protein [Podospora aff. communis PSN243]